MPQFQTIGIIAKSGDPERVTPTLERLVRHLGAARSHRAVRCHQHRAPRPARRRGPRGEDLGRRCDLVVVVGGDGTLLRAARTLAASTSPCWGSTLGAWGSWWMSPRTRSRRPRPHPGRGLRRRGALPAERPTGGGRPGRFDHRARTPARTPGHHPPRSRAKRPCGPQRRRDPQVEHGADDRVRDLHRRRLRQRPALGRPDRRHPDRLHRLCPVRRRAPGRPGPGCHPAGVRSAPTT